MKEVSTDSNLSAQLASVGIKTFNRVAALWNLTLGQKLTLLGDLPKSTFYAWTANPEAATIPKDTLVRISYILGIYSALEILYIDHDSADTWIARPNKAFNGRTPLEVMLGGQIIDLDYVRRYLDSARGGWN